ncbi:MAG TPA: hypothetical protein PLU15_01260 [Bacillota bacterium]|jgi:hypothetical protein|nr:hypothetical protein [Bacillota bacterium]
MSRLAAMTDNSCDASSNTMLDDRGCESCIDTVESESFELLKAPRSIRRLVEAWDSRCWSLSRTYWGRELQLRLGPIA